MEKRKQVKSPPCPWCGERIDLTDCLSRRGVSDRLDYGHLYFRASPWCSGISAWSRIDEGGGLRTWREDLIASWVARNEKGAKILPCPHCLTVLNLAACKTDVDVRHVAYQHSDVCSKWPGYELHLGKPEAVAAWIKESQERWRKESEHCTLLTDEQLRAAQRRGGLNQPIEAKRRGGLYASAQDRGGRIGMHRRWHVKRGVVKPECPLCVTAGT